MAIISGMEAAKVDDIKPFEMPVEEMAKGILAKQQKYDKNKELYGIGASALNFKVRDTEEDYLERQKIIDDYNRRIGELSESVGGDWSLLDNSQIQAEAMKSSQDKRVGHLVTAREQAELNEKLIKEIEKNNGFALKFGADPFTQSLYDKDGKLRDLKKWSVQTKLDHELAADNYFDHIALDAAEQVNWAYSHDLSTENRGSDPNNPYPVNDNVTEKWKQNVYQDFMQRDWLTVKSNEPKVIQVINNLTDAFIRGKEGAQYYAQVKDEFLKKGYSEKDAESQAKKAAMALLNIVGRKRINVVEEAKSDRFFHNYPNQDPGSPGTSNPRSTSKGPGGSNTFDQTKIEPITVTHNYTQEGLLIAGSFGDAAKSITSDGYSTEALGVDFAITEVPNVHGVAKATTMVPNSTSTRFDANGKPLATNTKNVPGTMYRLGGNLFGDISKNNYGNNPVAIKLGSSMSPVAASNDVTRKMSTYNLLKEYSDRDSETVKNTGVACFASTDLEEFYYNKIKKEYTTAGRDTDSPEARDLIRKEAIRLTTQFTGGENGDVTELFIGKHDDDKGYPVYSIREEYLGMKDALEEKVRKLGQKGCNLVDLKNIKPGDLAKISQEDLDYSLAQTKLKNLKDKIQSSEKTLKYSNSRMSDLTIEEMEDENIKNYVIGMEQVRAHAQTLRFTAGQYKAFEQDLAAQCQMDENLFATYVDPSKMTDKTKAENVEVTNCKLDAYQKALDSRKWSGAWLTNINFAGKPQDAIKFKKQMEITLSSIINGTFEPSILDSYTDKQFKGSGGEIYNVEKGNELAFYVCEKAGLDYFSSKSVAGRMSGFQDEIYLRDKSGKLITKPIDKVQKRNKYNEELATALSNSKNVDPRYKNFVLRSEEMKNEFEFEANAFAIDPNGTTAEKDLASHIRFSVETMLSNVTDGGSQNRAEDLRISRVHWGSSGSGDTRKDKGHESLINLDGELVKQIMAGYAHAGSGDNKKQGSINAALQDPNYTKIVSVATDYGHNPPFRAIMTTQALINGQMQPIKIEVPLEENSYTILNSIGIDANTIQYRTAIAKGYKETGNFKFNLTVPGTEKSASPTFQTFYRLPYDYKTATGQLHPKGTIVTFDVDDEYKPLDQKLNGLEGTNQIRFFKNEEVAANDFHQKMAAPTPGEIVVMQRIDRMEEVYKDYIARNRKLSPAQLQQGLKNNLNGTFGPGAYEAINKGGPIDAQSFTKTRADVQYKRAQNQGIKNPITSTEFAIDSEEVLIAGESDKSNVNLRIQNKKSNKIMETSDFSALPDAEMAKFYGNPKIKNAAETKEIADLITKGEKTTANPSGGYVKKDGQRYIISPNTVELQPTVGGKTITTKTGRTGREYQLIDPIQVSQGKKNPYLFVNNAVPNLDNKLTNALQDLVNYQDFTSLGGYLEISSGQRSIESNLACYNQDYYGLTNSQHLTGKAVDISTIAAASSPTDYSGPGYKLMDFAVTPQGQAWLEKNKLKILYHKVNSSEWHIHLEYNENAKVRFVNEHPTYKPNVIATK